MGRSTFTGRQIWIGRHEVDGDLLVFDPERSAANSGNYALFSLTQRRQRVFPISVIREKIVAVGDTAEWEQAFEDYRNARVNADAEANNRKADDAARRQRLIVDKHRAFLNTRKLPYRGTRPQGTNRVHRVTHCYSCKSNLNNEQHPECAACGWIICFCGACGCGYEAYQFEHCDKHWL